MVRELKSVVVSISQIQAPRSLKRRKDKSLKPRERAALRKYGQQRPLIVDPAYRLLDGAATYEAMKALGFMRVRVVTLPYPRDAAIASLNDLLDCLDIIDRKSFKLSAALASLSAQCSLEIGGVSIEAQPVFAARGQVIAHLRWSSLGGPQSRTTFMTAFRHDR